MAYKLLVAAIVRKILRHTSSQKAHDMQSQRRNLNFVWTRRGAGGTGRAVCSKRDFFDLWIDSKAADNTGRFI